MPPGYDRRRPGRAGRYLTGATSPLRARRRGCDLCRPRRGGRCAAQLASRRLGRRHPRPRRNHGRVRARVLGASRQMAQTGPQIALTGELITALPVTTALELPDWRMERYVGPCFGLIVRSVGAIRSGASAPASRPSRGGEVTQYTELLEDSRRQAIDRMVESARLMGGNAIVGVRFDSSEIRESRPPDMAEPYVRSPGVDDRDRRLWNGGRHRPGRPLTHCSGRGGVAAVSWQDAVRLHRGGARSPRESPERAAEAGLAHERGRMRTELL